MTLPWAGLAPEPAGNASAMARASLTRLVASVAVASGLAAAGRQVDLAGLDTDTGLLCAQVMDLGHEDGIAIRPALMALNDRVSVLMNTMQARIA